MRSIRLGVAVIAAALLLIAGGGMAIGPALACDDRFPGACPPAPMVNPDGTPWQEAEDGAAVTTGRPQDRRRAAPARSGSAPAARRPARTERAPAREAAAPAQRSGPIPLPPMRPAAGAAAPVLRATAPRTPVARTTVPQAPVPLAQSPLMSFDNPERPSQVFPAAAPSPAAAAVPAATKPAPQRAPSLPSLPAVAAAAQAATPVPTPAAVQAGAPNAEDTSDKAILRLLFIGFAGLLAGATVVASARMMGRSRPRVSAGRPGQRGPRIPDFPR